MANRGGYPGSGAPYNLTAASPGLALLPLSPNGFTVAPSPAMILSTIRKGAPDADNRHMVLETLLSEAEEDQGQLKSVQEVLEVMNSQQVQPEAKENSVTGEWWGKELAIPGLRCRCPFTTLLHHVLPSLASAAGANLGTPLDPSTKETLKVGWLCLFVLPRCAQPLI
jgi:hypothetical protein